MTVNLDRWCAQSAAEFREMEHIEWAAYPSETDRDGALVEYIVRTLGNPALAESREVVQLLAERHGGGS